MINLLKPGIVNFLLFSQDQFQSILHSGIEKKIIFWVGSDHVVMKIIDSWVEIIDMQKKKDLQFSNVSSVHGWPMRQQPQYWIRVGGIMGLEGEGHISHPLTPLVGNEVHKRFQSESFSVKHILLFCFIDIT